MGLEGYRGKDEFTLRVILVYRCGYNSVPTTVFSQQHSYFDKLDDAHHPRDIMLQELCDEIVKWQSEGDQIVLLMDANEHVHSAQMKQMMDAVGLLKLLLKNITNLMAINLPTKDLQTLLMAFLFLTA